MVKLRCASVLSPLNTKLPLLLGFRKISSVIMAQGHRVSELGPLRIHEICSFYRSCNWDQRGLMIFPKPHSKLKTDLKLNFLTQRWDSPRTARMGL